MFTRLGPYPFEQLGETVLVISVGDNAPLVARYLEGLRLTGVEDVVPAFDRVAVYFSGLADATLVSNALEGSRMPNKTEPRHHVVPACYEMGEDLPDVCRRLGLGRDAFVATHSGRRYPCRAIGFCPGFPYLGWLDDALAGLGRMDSPRLRVPAGSVAVVGRMTSVYPMATPGGWWLVGQTPLTIVDPGEDYFPISVGDTVEFRPISIAEYEALKGARL